MKVYTHIFMEADVNPEDEYLIKAVFSSNDVIEQAKKDALDIVNKSFEIDGKTIRVEVGISEEEES